MTRHQAFINIRKFHFSDMLMEGKVDPRTAYKIATKRAAEATFRMTSLSLNTTALAVWK